MSNDKRFDMTSLTPGRPLVMGILNCTPDSFSDGSAAGVDELVERALGMVEDGAGIIDIGGESTRPGAQLVDCACELERIIPVITKLRKFSEVPISVDTNKAQVAAEALAAGGDIINDITALRGEGDMAQVAADSGAPLILMHMRGMPHDMQKSPLYDNVMAEVCGFLLERVEYACSRGVKRESIILDPGFGFGKSLHHNKALFNGLAAMAGFEMPVLVGVSRKSMIGDALGLPVDERLEASLALAVLAAERGAAIVRVHDVKETSRALMMREALL